MADITVHNDSQLGCARRRPAELRARLEALQNRLKEVRAESLQANYAMRDFDVLSGSVVDYANLKDTIKEIDGFIAMIEGEIQRTQPALRDAELAADREERKFIELKGKLESAERAHNAGDIYSHRKLMSYLVEPTR